MRIDKLASAGLVAMVALSMNIQSAGAANSQNQALIENNLNTGLAQYQNTIQTGINAGQITPAEAASLQNELNRIQNMRADFARGGYDQNEVNTMLNTFNNFNNTITQMAQNGVTTLSGNGGGYFGGSFNGPYAGAYNGVNSGGWNRGYNYNYNFNNMNQVNSFRGNLGNRIARAQQRGVLSPAEAAQMNAEYNKIVARMNGQNMNGNFRNNRSLNQLAELDRRLNQTIAARRGTQWF